APDQAGVLDPDLLEVCCHLVERLREALERAIGTAHGADPNAGHYGSQGVPPSGFSRDLLIRFGQFPRPLISSWPAPTGVVVLILILRRLMSGAPLALLPDKKR